MNEMIGCLLIHGFGGSTEEVRPLAQHLEAEGYTVACPSLKGHTGKRRDLRGVTCEDWIASAREEMMELRKKCRTIYMIGFSMGGLIAFHLAREYTPVAIVTLNSPIYYWDIKRVLLNIFEDFRSKRFTHTTRYWHSLGKLPLNALFHFRLLLSKTKPLLKEIQCPVFVVQALEDDTVRKSSANYIHGHITSEHKQLRFYTGSGHLILWSKAAESVIKDVTGFIRGLR